MLELNPLYIQFQSAVGYEHHEQLAVHDSQKGVD